MPKVTVYPRDLLLSGAVRILPYPSENILFDFSIWNPDNKKGRESYHPALALDELIEICFLNVTKPFLLSNLFSQRL